MSQNEPLGAFGRTPTRDSLEVNLPSGRKITILETTGQEEKLFRFNGKKNLADLVNKFYAGICRNLDGKEGQTTPIQFEEMLIGDRTAILFYSRIVSHGSLMNYTLDCPHCESKSEHEIDIQEIMDKIKPYPLGEAREASAVLSQGTVYFELPTGVTEKKANEKDDIDVNAQLQLVNIWEKTANGRMPIRLENLRAKDIALLRKALRDNQCSIDSIVKVICTSCEKISRINLAGDAAFLFPNMM
jgi:hypothetical protein